MKKKSFYEQWGDEIKKESNKSAEEIDFSNILWNILMLIIGGLSWTQFFHKDNYVMRDIFEKIGLNYGGTVDGIMGISYLILVVIPIIYFRYIRVNKPLFWIILLLATVVHPIYRIMNLLN